MKSRLREVKGLPEAIQNIREECREVMNFVGRYSGTEKSKPEQLTDQSSRERGCGQRHEGRDG